MRCSAAVSGEVLFSRRARLARRTAAWSRLNVARDVGSALRSRSLSSGDGSPTVVRESLSTPEPSLPPVDSREVLLVPRFVWSLVVDEEVTVLSSWTPSSIRYRSSACEFNRLAEPQFILTN